MDFFSPPMIPDSELPKYAVPSSNIISGLTIGLERQP